MKIAFDKDEAYIISLHSDPDGREYGLDAPDELVARYYAAKKEFFAVQAELAVIARETVFSLDAVSC